MDKKSYLKPILIIVAFTFLAHGLILLNDGLYYDGWIQNSWRDRPLDFYVQYFFAVGKPIYGYLYWGLSQFDHWLFAFKLAAFLGILATAILYYFVILEMDFFGSERSLILALLIMAYPGYEMAAELATVQYTVSYPLFLLGWLIILKNKSSRPRILCAVILLLISFFTNSLLVFHFLFIVLWFLRLSVRTKIKFTDLIVQQVKKTVLLVALPFGYWGLRHFFFPPQGVYVQHYSFHPNFQNMTDGLGVLLSEALLKELKVIFFVPYFFVALIFSTFVLRRWKNISVKDTLGTNKVLFLGMLGLFLGGIPYILVGQRFTVVGWSTKNNLLLSLPFALICFGILQFIFAYVLRKQRGFDFMLIVSLFLFIGAANRNYLMLEQNSIRDKSFIYNLSMNSVAKECSIFVIYDPLNHSGPEEHFNSYFIPLIIQQAFKSLAKTGTLVEYPRTTALLREEVEKLRAGVVPILASPLVPSNGLQASIQILPGTGIKMNSPQLVLKYYYLKFFRQEALAGFISDVTTLNVKRL